MSKVSATSPMMQQYLEIKAVNPDYLLMFRMGDFFELFFEDAQIASQVLGIALTARGKHSGDPIPMAGVPAAAAAEYMHRLTIAGHRVAVCDQIEDAETAKARGNKSIVKRALVRLFSPGTLTEDILLNGAAANHLCCIHWCRATSKAQQYFVLAWVDLSIGVPRLSRVSGEQLSSELTRIDPAEVVVTDDLAAKPWFRACIAEISGTSGSDTQRPMITPRNEQCFDIRNAQRSLKQAYNVATLDGIAPLAQDETSALGALIDYIQLTQVGKIPRLVAPMPEKPSNYLQIDPATRRNLEIIHNNSGGIEHTLLSQIDATKSNAGARKLRQWLSAPSNEISVINKRLDAVGFWVESPAIATSVRRLLTMLPDVERSLSRLTLQRGGPKDLVAIRTALHICCQFLDLFHETKELASLPPSLAEVIQKLEKCPIECLELLHKSLDDQVPSSVTEGGFVRSGYDEELDEQRLLRDQSHAVIGEYEKRYREITGIRNLRIKSNGVLGYFIETSTQQGQSLVASDEPVGGVRFTLRQTLATVMRFSSEELAQLADNLGAAVARAIERESAIFEELCANALSHIKWIRSAIEHLARVDATAALGHIAHERGYTRPTITQGSGLKIEGGRHPTVEATVGTVSGEKFIPNDCELCAESKENPRLILLTGPNMAGKSTFLRQNVLIVILAQMGSWVPASKAEIGLVDAVYSRVGAADDLARGRSTFMVEMVETAAILNRATNRSLVILDEIGRGTATYDGLAIAWACVEYLHNVIGCRAIFATHYHEITSLTKRLNGAKNFHLEVVEHDGEIVFLHRVGAGAASRSWGVHVAKLAGLPSPVTNRANDLLGDLESVAGGIRLVVEELPLFSSPAATTKKTNIKSIAKRSKNETTPATIKVEVLPKWAEDVAATLAEVDIDNTTARQALDILTGLVAINKNS